MMCFDKPIGALALGAALAIGGAAFAQAPGSPYFYRFEHARGVYYIPGTPVLSATSPVERAAPGTPAGPPPLAMDSTRMSHEPLMTGRSVAIGVVGNHCETPATTCLLYRSSIQGKACSCKVPGGRSHGSVGP
jgi:hypothetical protein